MTVKLAVLSGWEDWRYCQSELMNAEVNAFLHPAVQHEQQINNILEEVSQRKHVLALSCCVIEERWPVGENWQMTKCDIKKKEVFMMHMLINS